MALALRTTPGAGLRAPLPARRAVRVVCQATKEEASPVSKMALPVVSLLATALVSGAMVFPEEALAAKSSGRVGGSSGFKSRKVESVSNTRTSTTVVNNVVVAPPVMAPPMFSPFGFGFGGFSIMPTFVMPVPFMGGLLQFFLLATLASVIFGAVRALSAGNAAQKKGKDDSWGDL